MKKLDKREKGYMCCLPGEGCGCYADDFNKGIDLQHKADVDWTIKMLEGLKESWFWVQSHKSVTVDQIDQEINKLKQTKEK